MPIVIDYPATAAGEPRPMNAAFLGGRAGALRRELFGVRAEPIEVAELAAKTKRLVVNGRRVRIAWDIEHDVRDNKGKPVLGLCEVDADAPDTVMISISGARLIDRPELFRSTAVHELAHAIFDMPAALGRKSRKAVYASGAETPSVGGGRIDWTEWRANKSRQRTLGLRAQHLRPHHFSQLHRARHQVIPVGPGETGADAKDKHASKGRHLARSAAQPFPLLPLQGVALDALLDELAIGT